MLPDLGQLKLKCERVPGMPVDTNQHTQLAGGNNMNGGISPN